MRGRCSQIVVPIETRQFPAAEPLGIKHCAVTRLVVAHPMQGLNKAFLQDRVEIRSSREHAVIVGRRGPDLGQCALRHQVFTANPVPERTSNRAGISAPVENGASYFGLARASITL